MIVSFNGLFWALFRNCQQISARLLDHIEILCTIHTISLTSSLTGCYLQDFTDSAYTSHDHRQNIILLAERARLEMAGLVRLPGVSVSSLASHMDTGDLSLQHNTTGHGGDGAVIAVRSHLPYCLTVFLLIY